MKTEAIAIFWFRRDLRLHDNAGLYHALKSGYKVLCVFVFDTTILSQLITDDARVTFIHQHIVKLKSELQQLGSDLAVYHTTPLLAFKQLFKTYNIAYVFCNQDYEPYATSRDEDITQLASTHHAKFSSYKDQCVFDYTEILKGDGTPYTVFTPYSKKWKAKLNSFYTSSYPTQQYYKNFLTVKDALPIPSLQQLGFTQSNLNFPLLEVAQSRIKNYHQTRDFPAIEGTSRLGIHYRFGTVSIRQKARAAQQLNETYLNELIWRDFYMMILAHYPKVVNHAFKRAYDNIVWLNDERQFNAWCQGKTGYPIVDAGMRELNETGYMHNRVRMIVASFLTKHLLIDWRWGEAYFASKLLDYDLSANNGGWQWSAGCGNDAAPYFRVFNPTLQTQKFDKDLMYIKRWVKELGTSDYPLPIVDHNFARKRCIETYKKALQHGN
jgi:deoxyribodipyrimidine photo-lyase